MTVAGHVARMGETRNAYKTWGEETAEDVGVDGRIIIWWILEKQGWKMWIGFI